MPDICHSDVAYKGSILCNVPAVSDLHYAEFLKNAGYELLGV